MVYETVKPVKLSRKQQNALDKKNLEEEAARLNALERLERDKKINSDMKKKEERAREKNDRIAKIRADWNVEINAVVGQVLAMRHNNPTRNGINAGNNGNLGTIPGGTDNAIPLVVPNNDHQISKADVLTGMHGYDSSDSGYYKFRRKDVLVHGC